MGLGLRLEVQLVCQVAPTLGPGRLTTPAPFALRALPQSCLALTCQVPCGTCLGLMGRAQNLNTLILDHCPGGAQHGHRKPFLLWGWEGAQTRQGLGDGPAQGQVSAP